MCGIAGWIHHLNDTGFQGSPSELIEKMTLQLHHRGPDGMGQWIHEKGSWQVALGHARLAIIDLSGGVQPMGTSDGRYQVTYNGEIYNFPQIMDELKSKGHTFRTRSDTEALLHHYQENGTAGLRDFNGMFAFAIWDETKAELCLARDRAGIKPLYYGSLPGGGLIFASELKAILEHPLVRRTISLDGLGSYFFSDYITPPDTILTGIYKLEPGQYVIWRDGTLQPPEYFWSLANDIPKNWHPSQAPQGLELEFNRRMSEAVHRQMVSDVPLGVFLSGGIDSSIVAALAQKVSKEPIQTFSIAFEDKNFDESLFARQVAKHIGSYHTEETLSEGILVDTTDAVLDHLDEPLADSSIIPTYLLSALAARSVKVALGGDGGDELWAGYPTYKAFRYAAIYENFPRLFRKDLIPFLTSKLPVRDGYQSLEWKLKRFAGRWDDDPIRRHLRWMSNSDLDDLHRAIPGGPILPRVFRKDLQLLKNSKDRFDLNAVLSLDFQTYMSGSVLTKVDRASMAHSLEVRPPFLDNEMVSWAFALPSRYKLRGRQTKYLVKWAGEELLPKEILYRPKKGFAIPLAKWLRGPFEKKLKSALNDSPLWESSVGKKPIMDRVVFQGWVDQHRTMKEDRSKPLWALVVLDHWMKREGIGGGI